MTNEGGNSRNAFAVTLAHRTVAAANLCPRARPIDMGSPLTAPSVNGEHRIPYQVSGPRHLVAQPSPENHQGRHYDCMMPSVNYI